MNSNKLEFRHWLLGSMAFCVLLQMARMAVTNSREYIFLPWNLFLAWIPFSITCWIKKSTKAPKMAIIILWLIFLPNSFYIITDLVHFTRVRSAPKWFDLLMIFSFAFNGVILGIASIQEMEKLIIKWYKWKPGIFHLMMLMQIVSFGIYIGRELRFNSWDVISEPFSLLAEVGDLILKPFDHLSAWAMAISYGIFITMFYMLVRKMGEEGKGGE